MPALQNAANATLNDVHRLHSAQFIRKPMDIEQLLLRLPLQRTLLLKGAMCRKRQTGAPPHVDVR